MGCSAELLMSGDTENHSRPRKIFEETASIHHVDPREPRRIEMDLTILCSGCGLSVASIDRGGKVTMLRKGQVKTGDGWPTAVCEECAPMTRLNARPAWQGAAKRKG